MPSGHTTTAGAIIAGAESIDLQEGNSHGVLLLHGFGDTPQTLRLLARDLHHAGYDVVAPLLPGHGHSVDAFLRSRRSEWLATARSALSLLMESHDTVTVGGLSMGGAIAAILAGETRKLANVVLMAPYLEMPITHRFASAGHWIWDIPARPRRSNSPGSILDPVERSKNLGYGVYSGRLLFELWRLGSAARLALPRISAPTLLIQSRTDPRIAPGVAERAFKAIGTPEKKLVWIEGAGHIITVDYGREKVFDEFRRWIETHLPAG